MKIVWILLFILATALVASSILKGRKICIAISFEWLGNKPNLHVSHATSFVAAWTTGAGRDELKRFLCDYTAPTDIKKLNIVKEPGK